MNNHILLVVVFVTSFIVSGCATSTLTPDTVDRIRTVLPDGWILEVQEDRLWIEKKELVQALLIFPSMSSMEDAKPTSYWFTLTPVEFVSPTQRSALEQHYDKLRKEADRLYTDAKINQIPHKMDKAPPWLFEYHPRSEEESRVVLKYKGLYSQIKRLPDVYLNGHSYMVDQLIYSFEQELEKQECETVLNSVLSLFNGYETESKPSHRTAGSRADAPPSVR